MTSIKLLETVVSLSVQLMLLLALLTVLSRRVTSAVSRERYLTGGLLLICCVTLAGFALPHLRLLSPERTDSLLLAVNTTAFERAGQILLIVWSIGATVTLIRLAIAITSASQFVNAASPVTWDREGLRELWDFEIERVDIPGRHAPQLLISERSTGPACWQFHQPLVVFHPRILEQCPLPQLRMMIRHELVHLSRQHPVQLFLQRLVETVFWFHPGVWRMSEELSKSREMACDELSIESAEDATTYLRSLLAVGAFRQHDMELPDDVLAFRKGRDWVGERAGEIAARPWEHIRERIAPRLVVTLASAAMIAVSVHVPLSADTSRRALWSPWPDWSARALHSIGLNVRDYEPHRYALPEHDHHGPVMPDDYESL